MTTFLNLNLNKRVDSKFFYIHILFLIFWLVGILIFVFRVDVSFYGNNLKWLQVSLPTIYFFLFIVSFLFLKWYYIIAFFLYPFLLIFWFIPKTVLSIGKVYLFGSYLSSIFATLTNFKLFLFNFFLFVFVTILFLTINTNWIRWISILTASYFYLSFLFRFLRKAFKVPALFGEIIEEWIKKFIEKEPLGKSILISSFIVQKDDEKLELEARRETQIRRTVLANYALDLISKRLNGYRGRQAYIVSWIFGSLVFLFSSIIFFWFINFQLYKINVGNFIYNGIYPTFDFLYYTLKTITFGDIELIKPISVVSRISETSSFFIIGIFMLVVVVSIILSLKQDKMNENVRLTTELFEQENLTLSKYMQDEFGMEISAATKNVNNIDELLNNLKSFIDNLF
jgi:hypothetical protein